MQGLVLMILNGLGWEVGQLPLSSVLRGKGKRGERKQQGD